MEGPRLDKFCDESTQSGKQAKAGYYRGDGILPFVLRDQVRFVRTWSPPIWLTGGNRCVRAYREPVHLWQGVNTLDFVPKSVCQGAVSRLSARSSAPKCKHFEVATGDPRTFRIPAERVRTYAEKWQNFTISWYSFMEECGILGLTQ